MSAGFLLDTHVLVRWLADPDKLSRNHTRILTETVQRRQPATISAITLIEFSVLCAAGRLRMKAGADEVLDEIEASPAFRVLPITVEIAKEVASLTAVLRDPADCVIAATARVHGLRLLTSDRRIVESHVVSAVE